MGGLEAVLCRAAAEGGGGGEGVDVGERGRRMGGSGATRPSPKEVALVS